MDYERMLEQLQDDWMDACKEIDALKSENLSMKRVVEAARGVFKWSKENGLVTEYKINSVINLGHALSALDEAGR